ncbi:hypothetical protein R3W88_021146 [Solanum pinnatisectum]|uniref:Uncharacterized protein n=1 Tax=Solanum pinnatisectum TaxID=50273 RepID=A0AAV9LRX3_9SOLN|nr:hypothetical protein R3W88_021146 [Solanum pinnatisectum]
MFAGGALIAIKEPLVKGSSLILVSLNLGSFINDANNHVLNHVGIWVMKDYGVKEYWVKFSIEQLEGCQHFSCLRPISNSVTGREFLWYNLEKKALKHAKISEGGGGLFRILCQFGNPCPPYMEVEMTTRNFKATGEKFKLEY